MRISSFTLSCLVVAFLAFGLKAYFVEDSLSRFWSLSTVYGEGVVLLVFLLTAVRISVAFVVKILSDLNTDGSQSDRLTWYKSYIFNYPWVEMIAAVLSAITVITSFTIYKALVIGADGYQFDFTFASWDRLLFWGNDPWRLTHAIFDSAAATAWLDFFYHPTFFPMLIPYLLCSVITGMPSLRYTYMISFLAGFFLIGMVGAGLLPSAGPAFDGVLFGDGNTFGPMMVRLQDQLAQGGGPIFADRIREYLLNINEESIVQMGGGISAMPSMHMVFVFLCVFFAWHLSPIFGLTVAVYAAIIWIGSVHLGWHYFVDGLVSLALISTVWRMAGHVFGLYSGCTDSS